MIQYLDVIHQLFMYPSLIVSLNPVSPFALFPQEDLGSQDRIQGWIQK